MHINFQLTPDTLSTSFDSFWEISAEKIRLIEEEFDTSAGSPVYTMNGKYTSRSWTEWTQGFQFGSSLLQYDATGEEQYFREGRNNTVRLMAPHVSDFGVHDHGFNNISTYGNLLRLMQEQRIPFHQEERDCYELALKISGAVQAQRWTALGGGRGFIYSFNGPHSLFVDTIRSCRSLAVSHLLGHALHDETGTTVSLLDRLLAHARATADYSVFYGEGRDAFDVRGRTAHESIFNIESGAFRCPNTQQGYSPFTTWTRGLAWAMCGFAELLEFIQMLPGDAFEAYGGFNVVESWMLNAATATCDFYIENTASDGIPYWDTGAPNLHQLGDYLDRPADPYNKFEPVDSSAAAIGAQGLLRLGRYLASKGEETEAEKFTQAGLTVVDTLLQKTYLSDDKFHQGLLLHSIYHQPNGWDYIPPGQQIPCGESCMWGDYHLREVVLYLQRLSQNQPYLTFFGQLGGEG